MPDTPNTARYVSAVKSQFSWFRDGGTCSCRRIAGSSSYSQHAWCNGSDVMTGPWNTAYESSRLRGNALVGWLLESVPTTGGPMRRYQAFGIRTILFWRRSILTGSRVSGHTDHVHVDFWPKGTGKPPCFGGRLSVVYPNGAFGSRFRLYPNYDILDKEEERPSMTTTYRTVKNVPADKNGRVVSWAKEVVDWGISVRLIIVSDDHPDDWNEVLSSGRYWTFEHRRRND